MPQYINPNPYDLTLVGPDGQKVPIRRGRRVRLPEFFERYVKKGFLQKVNDDSDSVPAKKRIVRSAKPKANPPEHTPAVPQSDRKRLLRSIRRKRKDASKKQTHKDYKKRPLGRPRYVGATEEFLDTLKGNHYPISNGIGIGILSYNRYKSLKRLVDSLFTYTDLRRTTVFISDDGSDDRALSTYLTGLEKTNKFVIIRNEERLGIAGNTNRLLRCLERFPKKILLNDDVEVLKNGWDSFYFKAMHKVGFHHFCCRTPGVYGAKAGDTMTFKNVILSKVTDKPHGAVMAFDHEAFEKVGYFDEKFGIYGVEHVDWSDRVAKSKLQHSGYFDVAGSDKYFKIHSDRSAVENRIQHLHKARDYHKQIAGRSGYIKPTNASLVPAISYVIPCRDIQRSKAIATVVNNIRAQRYPVIEIIVSEQDWKSRIEDLGPINKILVRSPEGSHFNKSKAFNAGVNQCSHDMIVLHDADTLALADYTIKVAAHLNKFGSCFLAGSVLYANRKTSNIMTSLNIVDNKVICEKSVSYFEGGSIGIKKSAYWKIGGFNEDFWGYGCEDCDFYARLSAGTNFHEKRHLPLLHIWHPRTQGWEVCHRQNKLLEAKIKELSIKEQIESQRSRIKNTKYAKHL